MRIGVVVGPGPTRESLRRLIADRTAHRVAWTADDGDDGVALARSDRPDLILVDVTASRIDGPAVVGRIMTESPCPIVVMAESMSGETSRVYRAMSLGALGAVAIPLPGGPDSARTTSDFVDKLATIAKLVGEPRPRPDDPTPAPAPTHRPCHVPPLGLLGASTGGPRVLAEMLEAWPGDSAACLVVVQHIEESYGERLVNWLATKTGRLVRVLRDGDAPAAGLILVAPGSRHASMDAQGRLRLLDDPDDIGFRPSIDILFRSVARHGHHPGAAALLTGMGRDGADGLLALKNAGWTTFAQAEADCAVFGMPRAALRIGATTEALRPLEIARRMSALLNHRPGART